MYYLSGASNPTLRDLQHPAIGLMVSPDKRLHLQVPQFPVFAADNGCFAKGASFRLETFLAWLEKLPRENCLFAVAPDVVGNAQATIERSAPILPRLQAMGFPAAFVAQDGLEQLLIPWDTFDCFFIGGSTAWKLSPMAASLVAQAKAQGKWVHMGRVNSYERMEYAREIGCDSVDGTFLAFGPDTNLPRLVKWLDRLDRQPSLWQWQE